MFPEIKEVEPSRALAADGNVIENAIDNIISKQETDNTQSKAFMRGEGKKVFENQLGLTLPEKDITLINSYM